MPLLNTKPPKFKKRKEINVEYENWRGGYDSLLRPTELKDNELAQADNIMLKGSGVPTGRWGMQKFFEANATGSIRGLGLYATGASLSELLALTDEGLVCKKDGASYSPIVGQSYPSGSIIRSMQLGGKTYLASEDRALTEYNGTALSVYATLAAPTGVTATNFSGVSGTKTWSWKIVTLGNNGGQTTPSTAVELPNLPQDLTETQVNVQWTPSSGASLSGYEIYRGIPGDETYLAAVGASLTTYVDKGEPASELILAPITNTTGGVKSKFIEKVLDRLVMVNTSDPTKLMISGRFPNQGSFNWADGGGYIYIDPDSGQSITGIKTQAGSNKIIVFKEYSSYAVTIDTFTAGNDVLLDPQYEPVSTLIGCSNPDTIQTVENDTFYFGRKGIYVVGFEPNFLNLIRTNEISSRIRPYLDGLSSSDYQNCNSMYVNNKYILSFPDKKECIVYDRERGAFLGIWKTPWGISRMQNYIDDTGTERWVVGSGNSNQIYTFEPSVNSDDGTTITKTLRTKKEYFGKWSLLKIIKLFYILFRNITGTVTVNILLEDRNGATTTIKTFDITGAEIAGASGWGVDMWGTALWGTSSGEVVIEGDELTRWSQLYKSGRIVQIEVTSTAANSNFELLGLRLTASSQGEGQLSSSSRV